MSQRRPLTLLREHSAPAPSPPLLTAPSLPRRDPLASPPSRRPSCRRAAHPRGNTALQSHQPLSRSLPVVLRILYRNPFLLPRSCPLIERSFPVTSHEARVTRFASLPPHP